MSLITRCPSCGTMFRVVPDQLKISEGWVRCGHCAEVFDAPAHMMAEPVAPETQTAGAPRAAPTSEAATPPLYADTQPGNGFADPEAEARAAAAVQDWMRATAAQAERGAHEPEADAPSRRAQALHAAPGAATAAIAVEDEAALSEPLRESALDQPFVFRRSDLGHEDSSTLPPAEPPAPARATPLEDEDEDEAVQHVSFMRSARRRAFWRRPLVRAGLWLLMLVLGLLLAAQLALLDRDRLAAIEPGLRPVLDEMCRVADCSIRPPRQIESMGIENSAFNKLRGDSYRLSFTLKNNAQLAVAVPSMELTLTDSQDQPVYRRVLAPADIGATQPTLAAGGEWSASVALAVAPGGQASRISGYRLLAFYP